MSSPDLNKAKNKLQQSTRHPVEKKPTWNVSMQLGKRGQIHVVPWCFVKYVRCTFPKSHTEHDNAYTAPVKKHYAHINHGPNNQALSRNHHTLTYGL